MNKIKTALAVTIAVFLVCIALFIFIPQKSGFYTPITDSIFVILGGTAGIVALFTSKTFGWKSNEGKVWLFLALAYLGWAFGELIWMYNEVVLHIEPFPSTADIFFIAAYLPMITGLFMEYRIIKEIIHKKEIVKASLLTMIVAGLSAYFILIPIALAADYDIVSKAISLSYPIGDIITLFPALVFFFVFKNLRYGLMSKSWLIIAIALALGTIADSSFAYLDWNELYTGTYKTLTDLTWLADYLLFAFGAYYHQYIVKYEGINKAYHKFKTPKK